MKQNATQVTGPDGGLRAGTRGWRGWHWTDSGVLVSRAVRCRREQWYALRGRPRAELADCRAASVEVDYLADDAVVERRCVTLHAPVAGRSRIDLLGWLKTPENVTSLRLRLADASAVLAALELHPVAERDPKCHPLANVPRWSVYQPPFPLERVLLPPSLEPLTDLLDGMNVEIQRAPRTLAGLVSAARGTACVLAPEWVSKLNLSLGDIERIAARSWLIADLETVARLASAADVARVQVRTHTSEHEIMSARVEYADVPTRGFALQDVFPYGVVCASGAFSTRVLVANRAWKRYADEVGFATLLASETPFVKHCGDVLLAARPVDRGELLATDLPWMLTDGAVDMLAPGLARHVLRMMLGAPLDDAVEYWNRWDQDAVLLRDISDLPRRFAELQAVRWLPADAGTARLGLSVAAPGLDPPRRQLMIRTGRIDQVEAHDGLPPEPMIIFMKHIARELRERTSWARRYLADLRVTWQFDTAAGLRHIVNYLSAAGLADADQTTVIHLRTGRSATTDSHGMIAVEDDPGLCGEGAIEYQARLNQCLREHIENYGVRRGVRLTLRD